MLLLPEAAGPHSPVRTTVARRPGSVRRTSSIDTARPHGLLGELVVTARARDLLTTADGSTRVVGEVAFSARIDGATRQLVTISSTPAAPVLEGLLGSLVGPGFRSRLAQVAPDERNAGTLLHLLLDDLVGATLVSGYAMQRGGAFDDAGRPPLDLSAMMLAQDDLCAGWAHDATMMVTMRATGDIPMPSGPPAPALERSDDPLAWHAMAPLVAHAMRRRRRLDITSPSPEQSGPEAPYDLDVHFRDSHMGDDGIETVVHEYSVSGGVDPSGSRIAGVTARADVLPWMECPGALASAERLAGLAVGELRDRVRREFKGTSTCTHLNDTLRSLGDVEHLVEVLTGASGATPRQR